MLKAVASKDYDLAEKIRKIFLPLEDLRNEINPIRVLHEAVALSGISKTGRHFPLLSGITESTAERVSRVAADLLAVSIADV